ncbi:hypothetical protein V6Z11_D01G198800 [Gossypium hirsutum]
MKQIHHHLIIRGLMEEISDLVPRFEHRVCARHLYAN